MCNNVKSQEKQELPGLVVIPHGPNDPVANIEDSEDSSSSVYECMMDSSESSQCSCVSGHHVCSVCEVLDPELYFDDPFFNNIHSMSLEALQNPDLMEPKLLEMQALQKEFNKSPEDCIRPNTRALLEFVDSRNNFVCEPSMVPFLNAFLKYDSKVWQEKILNVVLEVARILVIEDSDLCAFIKSLLALGIINYEGFRYWMEEAQLHFSEMESLEREKEFVECKELFDLRVESARENRR